MKYKYHLKTLTFLIFLFSYGITAYAQNSKITGKVTDATSGGVLPGVNILVKGTTNGTATNSKGEYTLMASDSDTLVFSYIGYKSKFVPVNGRSIINIALSSVSLKGQELVVIGYGEEKKSDKTGSITSITASDFNQGSNTSPGDLLTGKVAGVTVTTNDGAPGSGNTIRIRGGSSLSASNNPLYVVDGVPLQGGDISGMRNPMNAINPNDIQSITILKDASATAIYGSRASNGVIIITTKHGTKNQPLKVSYNGKFSVQTIAKKVNVLSPGEFRQVIQSKFGQKGVDLLGNANTNWQNEIYSNAFSNDQNVSLTGSYKTMPYRASLDFTGNNGILQTSKMDRLSGSLSLDPTFLHDQLKVHVNLRGIRVHNRFANRGAIGSAISFDPSHPVKVDTTGAPYGGYFSWVDSHGNPITIAPGNPMALLNQRIDKSTVYRSIGNAKMDYDIPFVPNLQATLNLGYDYSNVGNGTNDIPNYAAFSYNGSDLTSGQRSNYTQRNENQLLDFYVNYNRDLPSIESSLKFTGGYSWEHHYSRGSTYTTNYARTDTLIVNQNTEYATEHYIVSFFGRLNYSLKDRYLVTATLRDDGTSRFSKSNRWGLFPSVALAWKINKEGFLKNVNAISDLKLRLSYGETGEQRINQGDYPYLGRYTYSQSNAEYQFGDQFLQTLRPEGYNANLKWERTKTYNAGLDYGFINNRISGSIDAYTRTTEDLLNVIPIPVGTNFTNRILTNVGTLDVRGVEFNITGKPIVKQDSYWEINFNVTHEWNKITKLTNVNNPDYIGVATGGISGGVGNTIQINSVGYPRNAFYVYKQVYDKNGKPIEGLYVDRNGDGIINASDKYRYKSPTPSVTFGFSTQVQYHNWDMSMTARAEVGNYVYNNVASNYGTYSSMLVSQGYLNNVVSSIRNTNFYNAQYYSDYYIENASFLRVDNITVGYTFKKLLDQNLKVRVSGTVQNAFVITKYSGLDPEVYSGIDNNIYPRPRTFLLGLSLSF
jgi:TonB-linked SusC/RagA family outer membrane protein